MHPGRSYIVNQAAIRAAQVHRQRATHQIIQANMQRRRRQSVIFTVAPVAPPKTTSMGYQVAKTFTIHESEPVDGVIQYELLIDDQSVWIGMGDDRAEGLLRVIMKITDQEPETPDN